MSRRSLFASLALFAGLAFGQGTPKDDKVYDDVRLKLVRDRDVGGNAIEVVVVNGGDVTLKGKVQKESQRIKAEKIARKVKGVKSVKNELVVETR